MTEVYYQAQFRRVDTWDGKWTDWNDYYADSYQEFEHYDTVQGAQKEAEWFRESAKRVGRGDVVEYRVVKVTVEEINE